MPETPHCLVALEIALLLEAVAEERRGSVRALFGDSVRNSSGRWLN